MMTDVVSLPIGELNLEWSWREDGVNEQHVHQLSDLGGRWPPILVNRSDHRVVDGRHRIAAALRLGFDHIDAAYFDGDAEDAFIEFVRRNVHHGLPLNARDRKRAAARVLSQHPEWSDRRIAELCGMSAKTIGRVRSASGLGVRGTVGDARSEVRVGRDNRVRPAERGSARDRVLAVLQTQPVASLRTIARSAGVSPETVRIVRKSLSDESSITVVPQKVEAKASHTANWGADAALVTSEQGDQFVAWFDQTAVVDLDCRRWASSVPLSRVYEIADEARRRAEVWKHFANQVEGRSGRNKA